jgi:prepilin-type N-terminal cleavage/methylation domain-containing protein
MKRWEDKQTGFTIVELLIVIVVIAILAAITIVSYTGIREKATEANEKILAYAAVNSGQYPDSLVAAEVKDTSSAAYQYTVDNSVTPNEYALTASNGPAGSTSFYVTSTQTRVTSGIAPGHNLIVWDKPSSDSAPVNSSAGVTIDTSVYRNSGASTRLSPSTTGKTLRATPLTGEVGQVVTVSLWVLSDAGWNGTGNNSKIRFGAASDGTLLTACSYNGPKTTWTFITCSRTLTAGYPSVSVSVGNDGSTGNVWLDDISLSIK